MCVDLVGLFYLQQHDHVQGGQNAAHTSVRSRMHAHTRTLSIRIVRVPSYARTHIHLGQLGSGMALQFVIPRQLCCFGNLPVLQFFRGAIHSSRLKETTTMCYFLFSLHMSVVVKLQIGDEFAQDAWRGRIWCHVESRGVSEACNYIWTLGMTG